MDKIQRALVYNSSAVVDVCVSKDIVNTAINLHGLTPVAAAALGRTLTACAMLSSDLEENGDTLTVTINGGGAIGNIVVKAEHDARVRGYVDNPKVETTINENGKLDVAKAVGNDGRIVVVKRQASGNQYVGQCELVSGEIAEDFAKYFVESEQKLSAIALGVLIDVDCSCISAGGVFIHLLPDCKEDVICEIENIVGKLANISAMCENAEPKDIILKLFGEENVEFTQEIFPKFKCNCNAEMIEKIIINLGKEECLDILKTENFVKVQCPFCNGIYSFNKEEVEKLFG